jgi:uncharacterized protein with GYD domain
MMAGVYSSGFRLISKTLLERQKTMPSFLVQASYTSEALAALVKNPQTRSEVVRKSIESLGGKLVGAWMAFGDHDVVFIVDMPDTISAAAMALSVGAGGALKGTKTTLLITLEEGVEALKKASSTGYTPVQK